MQTTNHPTTSYTSSAASAPAKRRTDRSRLLVVGLTTIASASWWAVLVPAAGLTLEAQQGGLQKVGLPAIIVSTALISLAAWALLATLERFTPAARKAWTIVATITCLTSLVSPLTGGVTTGAKLGLASFHLLVGAIVILGLRRTALSAQERCNRAA